MRVLDRLGQPLAVGDSVSSVALSPSGTSLAVGDSDGTQVWNRDAHYATNSSAGCAGHHGRVSNQAS